MLVNKLGDPDKTVSSKACYLLVQLGMYFNLFWQIQFHFKLFFLYENMPHGSSLVIKHPNMKAIVINEVERMMFRPNVAQKAQYVTLFNILYYFNYWRMPFH